MEALLITVPHTCTKTMLQHVLPEHLTVQNIHTYQVSRVAIELELEECSTGPIITTHRAWQETYAGWRKRGKLKQGSKRFLECLHTMEWAKDQILDRGMYDRWFHFDFSYPETLNLTLDELGEFVGERFTRRDWPKLGFFAPKKV